MSTATTAPDFDGATYCASRDKGRLTAQLRLVKGLMRDGRWRYLSEIAHHVDAPEASVSARLRDLRKPKFGGFIVQRRYAGNGLWKYRVTHPTHPSPEPAD